MKLTDKVGPKGTAATSLAAAVLLTFGAVLTSQISPPIFDHSLVMQHLWPLVLAGTAGWFFRHSFLGLRQVLGGDQTKVPDRQA